eukprot:jgi/Bigna1/70766/fgenesh1_pg.13_\
MATGKREEVTVAVTSIQIVSPRHRTKKPKPSAHTDSPSQAPEHTTYHGNPKSAGPGDLVVGKLESSRAIKPIVISSMRSRPNSPFEGTHRDSKVDAGDPRCRPTDRKATYANDEDSYFSTRESVPTGSSNFVESVTHARTSWLKAHGRSVATNTKPLASASSVLERRENERHGSPLELSRTHSPKLLIGPQHQQRVQTTAAKIDRNTSSSIARRSAARSTAESLYTPFCFGCCSTKTASKLLTGRETLPRYLLYFPLIALCGLCASLLVGVVLMHGETGEAGIACYSAALVWSNTIVGLQAFRILAPRVFAGHNFWVLAFVLSVPYSLATALWKSRAVQSQGNAVRVIVAVVRDMFNRTVLGLMQCLSYNPLLQRLRRLAAVAKGKHIYGFKCLNNEQVELKPVLLFSTAYSIAGGCQAVMMCLFWLTQRFPSNAVVRLALFCALNAFANYTMMEMTNVINIPHLLSIEIPELLTLLLFGFLFFQVRLSGGGEREGANERHGWREGGREELDSRGVSYAGVFCRQEYTISIIFIDGLFPSWQFWALLSLVLSRDAFIDSGMFHRIRMRMLGLNPDQCAVFAVQKYTFLKLKTYAESVASLCALLGVVVELVFLERLNMTVITRDYDDKSRLRVIVGYSVVLITETIVGFLSQKYGLEPWILSVRDRAKIAKRFSMVHLGVHFSSISPTAIRKREESTQGVGRFQALSTLDETRSIRLDRKQIGLSLDNNRSIKEGDGVGSNDGVLASSSHAASRRGRHRSQAPASSLSRSPEARATRQESRTLASFPSSASDMSANTAQRNQNHPKRLQQQQQEQRPEHPRAGQEAGELYISNGASRRCRDVSPCSASTVKSSQRRSATCEDHRRGGGSARKPGENCQMQNKVGKQSRDCSPMKESPPCKSPTKTITIDNFPMMGLAQTSFPSGQGGQNDELLNVSAFFQRNRKHEMFILTSALQAMLVGLLWFVLSAGRWGSSTGE